MNREESLKEVPARLSHIHDMTAEKKIKWTREFVDKIYDSFESRSCENCEQWRREHKNIGLCKSGIDQCSVKDLYEFTTRPDFYCNKWEKTR